MLKTISFARRDKTIWQKIEGKEWGKVTEALKDTEFGHSDAKKVYDDFGEAGTRSVLSYALEHDPPLDVVMALVKLCPNTLAAADGHDRLPLHVACMSGVSKEVTRFIIHQHMHAVVMMDKDQRLPIHYAVEYACAEKYDTSRASNGRAGKTDDDILKSSLEIITALLKVAPESLYVSDRTNRETPIDIALRMEHESDGRNRRASMVKNALRPISGFCMFTKSNNTKAGNNCEEQVVGTADSRGKTRFMTADITGVQTSKSGKAA